MKVFSLRVGTRLILSDRAYQVSKIGVSGDCLLEEIATGRHLTLNQSVLLDAWGKNTLAFLGVGESSDIQPNRSESTIADLSDEEQREIGKRHHYVATAERRLGSHPSRRHLDMAITDAAEKINDQSPPSVSTVYRWWRRWRASSQDVTALRNRVQKARKSWKFSKPALETMNEVVESVYLTQQKATLQQTYDAYCHRMNQLNDIRTEPVTFPSRAQFYRLVEKYNAYDVMKKREGKRVAEQHFRMTGKGVDTAHILERIEVDHTPMDVFAFNPETGLSDGRPYLTVLLDHYSRTPLGFTLGFEPPSELSVMRALRNSIIPKTYLKEKYPEIDGTWDAYGIPVMLVCDNGLEFHSDQLRRVCEDLNIELMFCPKLQPQYKGSVERFLGTLNRAIAHRLGGTSFSSIQHRGDYNSQTHAAITLQQLDELIHTWIIEIYSHEIHRGTKQTPHRRWSDGLANYSPILPVSMTQFELALCKQIQRFLRHSGIELFGLFYNSYALAELRQLLKSSPKVKVSYDPENLGRIWVFDPTQGNHLVVECTDQSYASGLTLIAHRLIRKDAHKAGEHGYDANTQLERKNKFVEKIKKMQTSTKVTHRRRAARHKSISDAYASTVAPEKPTNHENFDLTSDLPDLPFRFREDQK
jgi:putative transposase